MKGDVWLMCVLGWEWSLSRSACDPSPINYRAATTTVVRSFSRRRLLVTANPPNGRNDTLPHKTIATINSFSHRLHSYRTADEPPSLRIDTISPIGGRAHVLAESSESASVWTGERLPTGLSGRAVFGRTTFPVAPIGTVVEKGCLCQ